MSFSTSLRLLTVLPVFLAVLLAVPAVQARTAQLRIVKTATPVATLEKLRIRLDWQDTAASGELQLWASRVDAPALGYHFRDLHWRCPLQRLAAGGWECSGALRAGQAAPMWLSVRLDEAQTRASLTQGQARLELAHTMANPDAVLLDLTQVPLAWSQALLAQAWPQGHVKAGTLGGQLRVVTAAQQPLRVAGALQLQRVGFENGDASIAGEGLGGRLQLHYQVGPQSSQASIAGELRGGEFLAGNTYVSLPATPITLYIEANQSAGMGWQLPRIEWRDGDTLAAQASAQLSTTGALEALRVQAHSNDMTPLKPRYLSGWMGLFGLSDADLHGRIDVHAQVQAGRLASVAATLDGVDLRDPAGRFVFNELRGDLRYSADAPVQSMLTWQGGQLYGLAFGAARLPFASSEGALRIRDAVDVPLMGGSLGLRNVVIRPPQGDTGMDIRFGLHLDNIDFGKVSLVLGLPAFQGTLGGSIPRAHYAQDKIDFDGGLSLQLFDGRVVFSELSLERPFGTAPSLSADVAMDDLDLLRLTDVLGFGSISGKLDGRVTGLRLVDWTPVAFDARFITDDAPGVRKRISQRAVQDIGSVGGSSFIQTLQGKAIALFKDFGYRRIGIGCHLENQICAMNGLHSAGNAFTIVEGAGVPRLDVVGYNRAVDWPTLVERLLAASKGEVAPVIH